MKTLLVVYHSMTGGTEQMARALVAGAATEHGVRTCLLHASATHATDVVGADALVFASPENLAAISGLMKDFFDRCYYAALEQLHKLYVRAGVAVPASEAGVTMPWHSLRHTFGTACAGRGVPLATLRDLMGHEKIETTLRYVQVSNREKRAAIELAFGRATVEPPTTKTDSQPGEK
jgi:multimeric flavodoxin WrbA